MPNPKAAAAGTCPLCDAEVPTDGSLMKNEILACPECGAELEVTGLAPLTLEPAPEVEEDWGE